jgi:hypothetical protein
MLDMIGIDLMVMELNRMCTFLIAITRTLCRNSEVMAIIFLKFLNNKIMAMAAMDFHIMADFLLIIL